MTYKGLPIFNVDLTDSTVINNVSIVDFPAIEEDFIQLSKNAELKFSVNNDKRIISGPVLVPDQPIYRRDENGKEFYIKFTKDIIKEFAIKFFKDHRQNEGNIQHQLGVNGITFFESYLSNKERNIAPVEFTDLPNGTWFVSAKVENEDVWNLIKDGTLKGFSIDVFTPIVQAKSEELETLQDLMDYLNK